MGNFVGKFVGKFVGEFMARRFAQLISWKILWGNLVGNLWRVLFATFFLGHFQPENFGNGRATIYFLVLVEVHLKFQKLCIETLGFDIWIQLLGFGSLDSTAR